MTEPNLADDETLQALLSAALDEYDPIPPGATALAVAAFELHHIDDRLAELVADSLVGPDVLFRREASPTRLLHFNSPGLSIEVELDNDNGRAIGVLSPPASIPIEVETVSTGVSPQRHGYQSDDLGRFQVSVPRGANRLRCYPGDEVVVTPWFTR